MTSNYDLYKSTVQLKKIKKFIKEKGITRAQLVAFLNTEKKKVMKSESDDKIIERINDKFGPDYVMHGSKFDWSKKVQTKASSTEETKYAKVYGFKANALTYKISPTTKNKHNVDMFLSNSIKPNIEIIQKSLTELKGLKSYNVLKVIMLKKIIDGDGDEVYQKKTALFNGRVYVVQNGLNLENKIKESNSKILNDLDLYLKEGSGYILDEITYMFVNIVSYKPLKGSSYVDLPDWIKTTQACINVKNKDDLCFDYAVLSCLHPVPKNADRTSKYVQFLAELNMKGIEHPVKLESYQQFEKQNDISINVLYSSGKEICPLYTTQAMKTKHVNLLLHDNHYVWIKNMSGLLNKYRSHKHTAFYCPSCLVGFPSEERLKQHTENKCDIMARVIMPEEDKAKTHFAHIGKQLDAPFVCYADFESIVKPINKVKGETEFYQEHEACSYGFVFVSKFKEYQFPLEIYRGPGAAYKFIERLIAISKQINEIVKQNKEMIITKTQEHEFKKAMDCHICGKNLATDRVRDHCHITGLYRGPAHENCNLQYKYNFEVPIFFHNLKGYDAHLLIRELGNFPGVISCISQSSEKFISFKIGNIVFKDSLAFLSCSLDTLSKNLSSDQFKISRQYYADIDDNKFSMLTKKGVYPYDYTSSFEKFNDDKLPRQLDFFSKLSGEPISDESYQHAQNVWKSFNLKSLGEYSDLYLKTDVLLLADVFENFRSVCKQHYGLDPAHYYTAPGLGWDAMLKKTGVTLDLLKDVDSYNWVQNNIKGGISSSMKRYSKANNKYMDDYDKSKPSSYLMYLDANNLYGWAMTQCLPHSDFKLLDKFEEFTAQYIQSIPDDSKTGYVLEVDLEYPAHLHDLHNSYPVAPENVKIEKDMLSDYCLNVLNSKNMTFTACKKLTPNLNNKKNYVLHYRNLKLYLQLGLKLTKVHKVMAFSQSPWLKPYIDYNTNQRTKSTNNFEKDFYKLMNNAVFGKTMENVMKRHNYRLVNNEKQLEKLTKKPNFQSKTDITENLMGVEMGKDNIKLDKNVIVGFSVLDLSKVLMYDFFYNILKKKYGDNITLLYTDTDSFILEIKTEDVYQDMKGMNDYFNFSE